MISRRAVLFAPALAQVGFSARRSLAKAAQPTTPVAIEVPPNSCDCHSHIIGESTTFPFDPRRTYTPEEAGPEEMSALHRALHIDRVVIVTPSVYGADNSATISGMKIRGKNARGVAVIGDATPEYELDALQQQGFVGIRINLASVGISDPAVARGRLTAAIKRMMHRRWHVQFYASLSSVVAIKDVVLNAAVPIVFDHFGGVEAGLGIDQPGFADLLELVKYGNAFVKLSLAPRSSARAPDYDDIVPFARALIAANPDRMIWGSDWPHLDAETIQGRKATDITPLHQVDDGRLFNQLAAWAPDRGVRKKILVDNPARLYSF